MFKVNKYKFEGIWVMNLVYVVMILICILIMFTMSMVVRCNSTLTKNSKKWFVITFIGISAAMLAELGRSVLDKHPISVELYRYITLIEFCITPLLPIPLSLACGIKKPALYTGICLLVHAAIEVVLAYSGLIFVIDSNGVYGRGDLYFLYIVSYVISIGYLIFSFVYISRRFKNRNIILIILALVAIFAGIIPSLIDREIKTAFLGMTFMAVILYNYYEDLIRQTLNEELKVKNDQIKNMQSSTIMGIANLIESRDNGTGEHVKNTSNYVRMLAATAKDRRLYVNVINDEFVTYVTDAAPLHDIGKIIIPDSILLKPGKLTPAEYEIIKTHATEGGKIIRQVLSEAASVDYLNVAIDVATYHHEKWDGTGYPLGLKGESIPVSARIMAICDVYDALIMERVYKRAYSVDEALQIIKDGSGSHFDPVLSKLFIEIIETIHKKIS